MQILYMHLLTHANTRHTRLNLLGHRVTFEQRFSLAEEIGLKIIT